HCPRFLQTWANSARERVTSSCTFLTIFSCGSLWGRRGLPNTRPEKHILFNAFNFSGNILLAQVFKRTLLTSQPTGRQRHIFVDRLELILWKNIREDRVNIK